MSTSKPAFLAKGTHVLQASEWIDERLGQGTFRRLCEGAGPSWSSPLPMLWYDLDLLLEIIATAARRLNISVEAATTEIALRNARHDLKSTYHVFLRILRPVAVLGLMPRMWEQYFRFGAVEVLKNEPGLFILATRGVPERFIGWLRGGWAGFLPETIRVAGGHTVACFIAAPERDGAPGNYSVTVRATYRT